MTLQKKFDSDLIVAFYDVIFNLTDFIGLRSFWRTESGKI